MQQKYLVSFMFVLLAAVIGFFIYLHPVITDVGRLGTTPQTSATCRAADNAIVTKVIDGDTVVVQGGEHVRLIGINADEKFQPCYDAAKLRLNELLLDKQVRLETDTSDVDQYGRCLRTIFLEEENIDVKMVQEGLAVARFYPPDSKYKDELLLAEKQAMENKKGCKWSTD